MTEEVGASVQKVFLSCYLINLGWVIQRPVPAFLLLSYKALILIIAEVFVLINSL